MDIVFVSNLILAIKIGVSREERAAPQRVQVDVVLFTDFTETIQTLNLQSSVNYATVRRSIQTIACGAEFTLLEELGHRILVCLLAKEKIGHAAVILRKLDIWEDAIPGVVLVRSRSETNQQFF
jgi:FolB domain-containing protein